MALRDLSNGVAFPYSRKEVRDHENCPLAVGAPSAGHIIGVFQLEFFCAELGGPKFQFNRCTNRSGQRPSGKSSALHPCKRATQDEASEVAGGKVGPGKAEMYAGRTRCDFHSSDNMREVAINLMTQS